MHPITRAALANTNPETRKRANTVITRVRQEIAAGLRDPNANQTRHGSYYDDEIPDNWLTATQLAELEGVTVSAIRKRAADGRLPVRKKQSHTFYPPPTV